MLAGLADGLEAAHAAGVIHRDVKPANLLFASDGTLKLVDFGLVRLAGEGGGSMTVTGQLVGTPYYMSPEQAMAKRMKIDHRTDIYSLGATLYELLTLRLPFRGDSIQDVCSQIITKDPTAPRKVDPRIPRDLETVVLKAMEKDRDRRYPSAGELAKDLRRFADGVAIRARRIGPAARAWRKVKRNKVRAALVAAVLVLAAAGALFAVSAREEAERRAGLEYESLLARAFTGLCFLGGQPEPGKAEDYQEAELFTRAIELRPDALEPYVGRALAPGRTLEERLADLDAAESRGLPARTRHMARAWLFGKATNRQVARREEYHEELRLAAECPAAGPDGALFEAMLLDCQGKRPEAIERLREAIESGSFRNAARLLRAMFRAQRGDQEGALEDLQALRAAGQENFTIRMGIASLWHGMERKEKGEAEFAACLAEARAENTEERWLDLVWACGWFGVDKYAPPPEPDPIEMVWRDRAAAEALERYPGSAVLTYERGKCHYVQKRYPEALETFERTLALDGEIWRARLWRAWTLQAEERYEEAEAQLEDLVRNSPEARTGVPEPEGRRRVLGAAIQGLSRLRLDRGRPDEALRTLDEALRDERWQWRLANEFHALRAHILGKDARRFPEALEAARTALDLDPRDYTAQQVLISILPRTGQPEEALAAADRLLSRFPLHAWTHAQRGAILADLKRREEAATAVERALSLGTRRAEAQVLCGRTLQELDRPEEALAAADRAIELDPDNHGGHCVRAGILAVTGRLEDALPAAVRAIELDRDCRAGYAHLGLILHKRGENHEALLVFEHALQMHPERPGAGRQKAMIQAERGSTLTSLGRFGEALAALDRSIELEPEDPRPHLKRGRTLEMCGRLEEAIAGSDRAVEVNPGFVPAHLFRGRLLRDVGKNVEALAAFDRAVELGGEDPWVQRTRGLILVELGRPEEALRAYERAIELEPGRASTHAILAQLLLDREEYQRAREEYELALELGIEDSQAGAAIRVNLGVALKALGKPEEALEAYDRAIELDPEYATAHYDRGVVLGDQLDRPEDALAAYRRAIELEPGYAEAHQAVGFLLHYQGDHEGALREIDRAVELGLETAASQGIRGRVLLRRERPEEALQAFRRVLELDPEDASAHAYRGFLLRRRGEHESALADLDRALELGCENAWVHFERGNSLIVLGRTEDALEAWDRAIALDPECAAAHANRGYVLYERKAYREALEALDLAVKHGLEHAKVQEHRGVALLMLGRPEDALAALDEAMRLEPERPGLHFHRARALQALDRHDEALSEVELALRRDADSAAAHYVRGMILHGLGRLEESRASLERALELDGGLPAVWDFLANVLAASGRMEEARQALARALETEPRTAGEHSQRGWALSRLGRHQEALERFERACALAPDSARYPANKGLMLSYLRRHREALAIVEPLLEAHPDLFTAHMTRLLASGALGRGAEALEAAGHLVRLKPAEGFLHVQLARAHVALGQFPEALGALDRALELGHDAATARMTRSQALLGLSRFEEALAELDRVLEMEASLPSRSPQLRMLALESRARALNRLGRCEEALAACDEAEELVERFPEMPSVRGLLELERGFAWEGLGRIGERARAFERALELGVPLPPGGKAELLNAIAWHLATAADPEERDPARAIELARSAAEQAPGDWGFLDTLAVACYRAGKWREALDAAAEARRRHEGNRPVPWFFVAMAHWRLGEKEEAREWYRTSLETLDTLKDQLKPWELEQQERFRAEAAELLGIDR
jgi:tetratricopeptide (TPR) repeat protein